MANKRGSAKKAATKKSSAKKSAAKKSSGKSAAKGAAILPPNLNCINACVEQFSRCLDKGVSPALCQKRLVRCIQNCTRGRLVTSDE